MRKPLIIISEPYDDWIVTIAGVKRKCLMIPTNRGILTPREVAKILKIAPGTVRSRLKVNKWNDPCVVTVGPTDKPGKPLAQRLVLPQKYIGSLESCGTSLRNNNLNKIPKPSLWEQSLK